MQLARPAFALDPRLFGKGRMRDLSPAVPEKTALRDEVKLFATAFAAGFLFVSILIG